MTISSTWYTKGLLGLMNKEADLNSDSIYCALLSSGYTPARDTDAYWADVSSHEVTGTGYTANGAAMTSLALTTGGTHEARFGAANTTWTSSTITARYAVVYDRTPSTAATRLLICYVDFGADQSSSAGTFEIDWASGLVAKIAAA